MAKLCSLVEGAFQDMAGDSFFGVNKEQIYADGTKGHSRHRKGGRR